MTDREKRMLTAVRMLVAIADSTLLDYEDAESVVAANWDILGPRFRSVVEDYADCPVLPV